VSLSCVIPTLGTGNWQRQHNVHLRSARFAFLLLPGSRAYKRPVTKFYLKHIFAKKPSKLSLNKILVSGMLPVFGVKLKRVEAYFG